MQVKSSENSISRHLRRYSPRLGIELLESRIPLDVNLLLTTDGPLMADPGDASTDAMLIQTVNQSNQTNPQDNMAGWQISLQIRPLADATGAVAFDTLSEPSGYVFSSIANLGLSTSISDDTAFAFDLNFPFSGGVEIPTSAVNLLRATFSVSADASGDFGLFAVGGLGNSEWGDAGLSANTFANAGGGLTEIGRITVAIPVTAADVEFSVTTAADSESAGGNLPQLRVNGEVTVAESAELEITGGSASLGSDFTLATTVTIPAGQYDGTSATAVPINLSILNDNLVELDETVQIGVASVSAGLEIGDADGASGIEDTHTFTINNDDAAVINLAGSVVSESMGQLEYTVSLSNPVDTSVTVEFDTLGTGSATPGGDFTPIANQMVSFNAGSTSTQIVSVSVVDDGVAESLETIVAQINSLGSGSPPRNVSIGTATATGTILDDDVDAPVVVDVLVSASSWNSNLSPFSLFHGENPQAPLSWFDLDTIAIRFSKNVEVVSSSLTLVGVNQAQYSPSGFSFDMASFTATWTFSTFSSPEKFLVNLAGESHDANAVDDLVGPGGTLLNGGSDYEVRFDALPGDTGRDGQITQSDLPVSRMRATAGPPVSPNFASQFDVDGNGTITITDLVAVAAMAGNTLPAGDPVSPQALIANSIVTNADHTGQLTEGQTEAIADEAIRRWKDAGISSHEAELLESVSIEVVELPGAQLGMTGRATIWLDRDAAGHGWFVDDTPADDAEFEIRSLNPSLAKSQACDRIDLLTAVMHEMGHLLGRVHSADGHDLLNETLSSGVRKLPSNE